MSLVLACAGLMTLSAPSAQAANGCTGALVEVAPFAWSLDGVHTTTFGELQIYYDAGKGKNCVSMVHRGSTWGKAYITRAEVQVCDRAPGGGCYFYGPAGVDQGNYGYYANAWTPVSSRGRCIVAKGWIALPGAGYFSGGHWYGHVVTNKPEGRWTATHCG